VDSKLSIWLAPVARAMWQGETTDAQSSIPGEFSFPILLMDDHWARLRGLSGSLSIQDVTYGGGSMRNAPLRLAKAMGNYTLRIVVAHDGGSIAAKVTDKDGNPVPDSYVAMLPAASNSEAALADTLVSGETDQNGVYTSAALAPGKYYVLATGASIDKSPESIGRLWRARSHGAEADVGPNTTVQLTLRPEPLTQ